MKKCGWLTGHCLHKVDGTERKKKSPKKKICAQEEDDYIYERFFGRCVDVEAVGNCCWCGKSMPMNFPEYNTQMAMEYPDVGDK